MQFGWENMVCSLGELEKDKILEQPNQERIRKIREKENYKYLGKLEAMSIKQTEVKKIEKKNTSEERVNFSKSISLVEISWKE